MLRDKAKIEAAIRDEFAVRAPWLDIRRLATREIEMYGDIVLWVDVFHATRDRKVDLFSMSTVSQAIRDRLEQMNAPNDAVFAYKPDGVHKVGDVTVPLAH
jgi:hypothetical protein